MSAVPFKANAAGRHHIPRQRHRVTNWPEYDAALRQRGSLTVWFTEEAIASWRAEPRTTRGYLARIKSEFDKRGVKIIGLSVDPVDNHARWAKDIAETQGFAPNYPMIGDTDLMISKAWGMLPASRNKISEDLLAMMQAKAVDAAADYVRRGRAHRGLTDADLAGAWVVT